VCSAGIAKEVVIMIDSALEGREPMVEKLYTIEQAAEVLQVNYYTMRRWIAEGRIKAVKLGGRLWRIQESDLEAFVRSGMRSDDE
jgi:excisionase family DNA binding protein